LNSRPLTVYDVQALQDALDANEIHPGQKAEYYTNDKGYTEVYEDEFGPIGFLRYSKSLRLNTVWCDNGDRKRNGASIIQAISDAVEKAKSAGFTEIIFQTDTPALARFCTERLGFTESKGEFIKYV
jgi:hypothetical protein